MPLGIDIDCHYFNSINPFHLLAHYGFLIKDVFARLVVVKRGFTCFFKCDPICYFQNPYLVSKLLEVLYVINPTILDSAEALHARFMSHPISEEYLPSALMKFYTGKPKPFD